MTIGKALVHFAVILGVGLVSVWSAWPQVPAGPPTIDRSGSLVDPQLLDFVKVFGFGAMIFLVWWGDYRKIERLNRTVEQYEQLTKNYEKVTEECRDTMLLTMQTNAKLTAKLEVLLSGKVSNES